MSVYLKCFLGNESRRLPVASTLQVKDAKMNYYFFPLVYGKTWQFKRTLDTLNQ